MIDSMKKVLMQKEYICFSDFIQQFQGMPK